MTNILILNGHPNPDASTAGKAVQEAFRTLRPDAKVRTLAALCGSDGYDVAAEQAALVEADVIVWHFPFYWYSVPALVKKWIDDVLAHGFAYGSGGTALHGKHLLISFTTGAPEAEYAKGKSMNWPVEAFLPPIFADGESLRLENARSRVVDRDDVHPRRSGTRRPRSGPQPRRGPRRKDER